MRNADKLDLCDLPCGKDNEGSAMSNVWKRFQDKVRSTVHLQKKIIFSLFYIEDINISDV